MTLTTIAAAFCNNGFAGGEIDTTVGANKHLLGRRSRLALLRKRSIPLFPYPPDHAQKRKKEKVFHHNLTNQKVPAQYRQSDSILELYRILGIWQLLTETDPKLAGLVEQGLKL
jgi:hypothetical protein